MAWDLEFLWEGTEYTEVTELKQGSLERSMSDLFTEVFIYFCSLGGAAQSARARTDVK